jgi:hypothetical protein
MLSGVPKFTRRAPFSRGRNTMSEDSKIEETEKQEAEIAELSEQELDEVAGGLGRPTSGQGE